MLNEYDNHNIYIRHAIDEKPRLVNDDMHIHSRCEIYFFISGKVDYLVEIPEKAVDVFKAEITKITSGQSVLAFPD